MSDAMSDYYKQESLEKQAREMLKQYRRANGDEKEEIKRKIEYCFGNRAPEELAREIGV
ncbi:hypothetical protein [Aquibacillus saliphilus]|uniref:hypothetical protein n=1 Tax=Aquibacillus saliphilus TaxID=1909422 RepID=UPI001CF0159A|nr:hypothetical protein [Aquibacillus saliphilus]